MIVNPKINEFLKLVSEETIKFENSKDIIPVKRTVLYKFLRFYKNQLNENEQVFLMYYLLNSLYHKNMIIDPETILMIHNIKLRTIFTIIFGIIFILITAALLFKTNNSMTEIIKILEHILDVIKL